MKKIFISVIVVITCFSAIGQKSPNFYLESQFKDFVPISPIEYEQNFIVINDDGVSDTLTVKQLAEDKESILKLMPNEAVSAQITTYNSSGQITYGPASITGEKGSYTVIMDYVKFTTAKVPNGEEGCLGFAKVGIGLRIRANIETRKAGLNLGGLFNIGLQAEKNKLSGTLTMDIIGMESKEVTSLIPLPSEISLASISNVLQSMSAIKAQIYNSETRLYPQIIAIKTTDGSCGIEQILKRFEENEPPAKTLYLTPTQQQQIQQQRNPQQFQQQQQQRGG
jgi:hypothetical protein